MSELLTIKEAASYLRMNPLTVYRLASKGKMPAVKVGRHWRVHQDALESWLRPEPPRRKPFILVADDEESIRHLFRGTLGEGEYHVVLAHDGEEALEAMDRSGFDLVFLDLKVPGMNGAETFRRIREVDSRVPVVIITGYPDSDLMAQALEIGPIGVMMKPFGPQEIEQVVSSFVPGQEVGRRGRAQHAANGT
ncbi:MAG: response regulator [Chloroflexi bacterium]|nr:response regulator [Chloroflexota bacterium]